MTSESPGSGTVGHDGDVCRQIGGVNVRVSGLQEEDIFTRDGVYNEIEKTIRKLMKMMTIADFKLNLKKYHETGNRKKYSVKVMIISDRGMFHADDYEWSIFKAVEKTLAKMENEVFRKEDRGKVHTKAH
jgi:ribosome-associated translation inhibitor RaiA